MEPWALSCQASIDQTSEIPLKLLSEDDAMAAEWIYKWLL